MEDRKSANLQFVFLEDGFQVDYPTIELEAEQEEWKRRFLEDRYLALYQFGLGERPGQLSPSAQFLYQLSDRFFRVLTSQVDIELLRDKVKTPLSEEVYQKIINSLPFALGAEHVNKKWIRFVFKQLRDIFKKEISSYDGTVSTYITEQSQSLRVPERVFFHLVESKKDDFPFSFLATYATEERKGKVRHVPLEYALTEYKNDRGKLLALLSCLNKVAEVSPLISGFVESGEMFHPLRLTAKEAFTLLKDIPKIEAAGVLCRVPNWWKKGSATVSMRLSLGEEKPSLLGVDSMLSLEPQLILDGTPLTAQEIQMLLRQTNGLAFLKGKWVEVNQDKLKKLLTKMDEADTSLSLFDALRMNMKGSDPEKGADVGAIISNGAWLNQFLAKLRNPATIGKVTLPQSFLATLRPYQKKGFSWLNYMGELGFGACLADDMGLGKTIQVLAYLEKMRASSPKKKVLLVVPASLLGNWEKEAQKFSPTLPLHILHGRGATVLGQEFKEKNEFLTITTYGMAARISELQGITWDCIILDEAQAIKNPVAKQTRAIKKLKGSMRIAMTGTPIENDLTNLWSLFDFLNKGLLGSSQEFRLFCKNLDEDTQGYAKLKAVISPFMLRRLKTDKKIISDLPEKNEMINYVKLSKKQVVLYRKLVADLEEIITETEGIHRRGIVMSYLTRFKQLCNHPDQYLGQQVYDEHESGKFEMLRELCETIYQKRERVLVFTQFTEIIEHLKEYLTSIFHREGYVLHGKTPISKRQQIVEAFQGEEYIPYIILSVRAGGTGLNLTKANHIIHFDRWWNPAVENQATDRAYRIGQKKNVMVHKLVSSGTIEEKIDELIHSKKELSENVIGKGGENWITEMSNDELMSLLKLG
jgi:non-specific serine/threonine protein kinase